MATNPFKYISIQPHYAAGFAFCWEISQSFFDALPWTFRVQQGPSPDGPWTDVSPGLENIFSWAETSKRLINKDVVLYFRIKLTTPKGEYYSHVKTPYGDVGRREYLLIREMMRKEVLQARTLSGIMGKLWIRATFGPKCTHCIDPITGDVKDSNCPYCFGTGREPGYHGPYDMWMTFSPADRDEQMAPDGSGTRQPYSFSVRAISCPVAKDCDVIIDPCQDKRYYVDKVQQLTEIRRIPVVQTLIVHEAPNSEPIYRLGT